MRLLQSLFFLALSFNLSAASLEQLKSQYKRPDNIPFPEDTPYNIYKATLGKMLFFDPRLSKNQNMSCASCHNPSFGWESALSRSVGSQNTELGRHSPTTINMAWGKDFFWDGRAKTLEEQSLGPIQNEVEMAMDLNDVVARIKKVEGYTTLFNKTFSDGVNSDNIAKAIATFERTVISGLSPFDKWIIGNENAISENAKKGFVIFNEKGRCAECHSGWNFTDNQYHDIGLNTQDEGRYLIDSASAKNRYAFKTPALRNIAQRAPYMHNGETKTLHDVVLHYMTGGINRPSLSNKMKPVPLSLNEINQLVEFLNSLQGEDKRMPLPTLPL